MHFHIPDLGILPIYNHDIISEGSNYSYMQEFPRLCMILDKLLGRVLELS